MLGIITAIILWVSGSPFDSNQPEHQYIAQQPTYEFRSTTQQVQPTTAWGEKRTYAAPFSADYPGSMTKPRKAIDPDDDDEKPDYDPFDGPIGDVPWIMMLILSAGYCVYRKGREFRKSNNY